jgi:hypothetical protein
MLPDYEVPSASIAGQADYVPRGWWRVGIWVCVVISVATVVRRLFALAHPSQGAPPSLAELDAFFASHVTLTLAHIFPALAFVALVPFVIFRASAGTTWPERLLYPLGAVVGLTAYAMSIYSYGGWVERSAVLFFNTTFLFCLFRAYRYARDGEQRLQRRWIIRAIVILLGIATTRPVMGIFFATIRLTHLQPWQFFGWAFWIGFSTNLLAVELWLRFQKSPSGSGGR